MGQLILCTGKPAEVPYHMESTSVNIYSLEELSYYLIHNTEYIDADFMSRDFCKWVYHELKEEELAKELQKCLEKGVPFHAFAGFLLQRSGYATAQEIQSTQRLLFEYETKDELEQCKLRADRMLQREKYASALEEYRKILQSQKQDTSKELLGKVYHNMGTAYAKMFLYEQAAEYFHKAYEKNHHKESLKEELLALKLWDGEELEKRALDYGIGKEIVNEYEQELKKLEAQIEQDERTVKIQKLYRAYRKNGYEADKQELLEMMENWKQEYRAYSR